MISDFIHEFVPGSSSRTLLLLHGTGGNERDLIPLGRELDPNAALLSPRGKVLENGMPRFFRRLAEGVFDLEDLKYRTNELADFVTAAAQHYGFAYRSVSCRRLFERRKHRRKHAITSAGNYAPRRFYFAPWCHSFRTNCPTFHLCAFGSARVIRIRLFPHPRLQRLVELLRRAGADVTIRFFNAGHGLTNDDVVTARDWLEKLS